MDIQEHVSLKAKTTMRIGGTARYFADLQTKEDIEEACAFAKEKDLPLIILGGGSNTIFTDQEVHGVVVRIKADNVSIGGNAVTVEAGKTLAVLINELAKEGLDLSALTGIPGSVGGAIFGNAGQGPKGVWIDSFVENVEAFVDGKWETFSKGECGFAYRESGFKLKVEGCKFPPIIWSVVLNVPSRSTEEIEAEVERLIQRRIETQPHRQTAGSCFKAVGSTPAWQLIDAVGMRGHQIGGITVSEKHANFLMNAGGGTFEDAKKIVHEVKNAVREPLEVEMRFVDGEGGLVF